LGKTCYEKKEGQKNKEKKLTSVENQWFCGKKNFPGRKEGGRTGTSRFRKKKKEI